MNSKITTSLLCLLPLLAADAATHAVLPGGSIQEKIDLAQPGDVIAIFGGDYSADITINKAVRLVEVDGQDVTITGNVTFDGVTNAPPFEGFTVGSSGKGITANNTTGLLINGVDVTGSGIAVIGNSSVAVLQCSTSSIQQDGGELSISRTVTDTVDTTAASQKTVAFQAEVSTDFTCRSQRAWFGYCTGQRFRYLASNGSVVFVGCTIDGLNKVVWRTDSSPATYRENYGIDVRGSSNIVSVVNNTIVRMVTAYDFNHGVFWAQSYGRGISISAGNNVFISNNYIQTKTVREIGGSATSYGIYNESIEARIFNNILQDSEVAIDAPFGVDCRNNYFFGVGTQSVGGHLSVQATSGDPLFIPDQAPKLQASSPCINTGNSDPIFNDLDGSRNDIGPGGGCLYDPDGWTTDNPVVISFDLAPQQLLKGVDAEVQLSEGQAVAQP